MAPKRRKLFLYLTLACFLGLIAIFIVDGYLGIYDTVYITGGEYEHTIEADFWLRQDRFWATTMNRDENVSFRYEVDNRLFSSYAADVEVSVWYGHKKVSDLLSQPMSIAAFDKGQLEWVVDTTELLPDGIPAEQIYQYTVIIKRGEIERRIIMTINPSPLTVPPR